MRSQTVLSTYLVKPNISRRYKRHWNGFRTQAVRINRYHPRIVSRTIVALSLWGTLCGSVNYILSPHKLPGENAIANQPSPVSIAPSAANTTLITVTHAEILPSGPSGQLLPPGTMAPDIRYANTYTWGNCTWYVASRRQIPSNWGNARSWFYNAVASGWSTGADPAIAAIAWTPAGSLGHVALVEQISEDGKRVFISEMNWNNAVGRRHTRWADASDFKYIY